MSLYVKLANGIGVDFFIDYLRGKNNPLMLDIPKEKRTEELKTQSLELIGDLKLEDCSYSVVADIKSPKFYREQGHDIFGEIPYCDVMIKHMENELYSNSGEIRGLGIPTPQEIIFMRQHGTIIASLRSVDSVIFSYIVSNRMDDFEASIEILSSTFV